MGMGESKSKRLRSGLLVAATALAILLPVGLASAQRRQPKVIKLDEIRIEGRVQKPNAFYILNRSNLGYEVMDLRTSFVRDIIKSVQKDPF